MIKNSPLAPCASVSYIYIFYVHDILGYFWILKRVNQVLLFSLSQEYYGFPILKVTHIRLPLLLLHDMMHIFYAHDILGYFCILKRVNQVLWFLLPHTMVFQYLRQPTYVFHCYYYMISRFFSSTTWHNKDTANQPLLLLQEIIASLRITLQNFSQSSRTNEKSWTILWVHKHAIILQAALYCPPPRLRWNM